MHSQIPYSLPTELLCSYIFTFVFELTSGYCHLSKLIQEKKTAKITSEFPCFILSVYVNTPTHLYIHIPLGRGVFKSSPWGIWTIFHVFVKFEWISLDTEMQDNLLFGRGCVNEFFTHPIIS